MSTNHKIVTDAFQLAGGSSFSFNMRDSDMAIIVVSRSVDAGRKFIAVVDWWTQGVSFTLGTNPDVTITTQRQSPAVTVTNGSSFMTGVMVFR